MKNSERNKLTIQIALASLLVIAGLVLLFMGFYAVPVGAISASVLTAYGEVSTFAGALLGIDYTYKFKMFEIEDKNKNEIDKENE